MVSRDTGLHHRRFMRTQPGLDALWRSVVGLASLTLSESNRRILGFGGRGIRRDWQVGPKTVQQCTAALRLLDSRDLFLKQPISLLS